MGQQTRAILILKLYIYLIIVFISTTRVNFSFAAEGLSFGNQYLHPGKADVHYLHTGTTDEVNVIWWSPVFKGGAGLIDFDAGGQTEYSGGYIRPLFPGDGKDKGELILGFLQGS